MAANERTSFAYFWLATGRVLSAVAGVLLVLSGVMKIAQEGATVHLYVERFGVPARLIPTLGCLEIGCALLYLIPQTAVLGAVLLTGYLGGAMATELRCDSSFYSPLALGLLAWGGLYLRERRLVPLLPLRRPDSPDETIRTPSAPRDRGGLRAGG